MLQDLVGITIAFVLFAFIFVFPGHVTGWLLDVFSFRKRTIVVQILMGMVISLMIAPAILYTAYRFSSPMLIMAALWITGIISVSIVVSRQKRLNPSLPSVGQEVHNQRTAVGFAIIWGIFSVLTLINLQMDHRLYFSNNAYDLTTRVSVVDAITRTGVPPINPTYHPGKSVELNFLYYYWYILGSLVDQMGGRIVSAYHAMIASITWAGALLFATMAVYLRVRDNRASTQIWKKSLIAMQLFAISGLDIIVLSILLILFKVYRGYLPFQGGVEGWNMPVMSWLNAIAWVPHHLVAALACVLSIPMLLQMTKEPSFIGKLKYATLIGLGFASAFGLSVWVMVIFSLFWGIWLIQLLVKRRAYQLVLWMSLPAFIALLMIAPFLYGLIQSPTSSSGAGLPVALYVRPFMLSAFIADPGSLSKNILDLIFLPLNYIFEFGFFFLVAVVWYQQVFKSGGKDNPWLAAELLLVIVSTVTLSFVHSNLIAINDIGIRGWLPMQFVLVAWAADIILPILGTKIWIRPKMFSSLQGTGKLGRTMGIFLVIGMLTTGLEFVSLRTWSILVDLNVTGPNNGVSPDTHLGERTYEARRAYEYLRANAAPDAIVQSNPLINLDRPAGLYGSHQMVIADRTAYGVPADVLNQLSREVGLIFTNPANDWSFIDSICRLYSIDYIIINDIDPIWKSLETLKESREPFYQNTRYIIFACGDTAS